MNKKNLNVFYTKNLTQDISNILTNLFKDSDYKFYLDNEILYAHEVFGHDGILPLFLIHSKNKIKQFRNDFLSDSIRIIFIHDKKENSILGSNITSEFFSYNSKEYFYFIKFFITFVLKNPIFNNKDVHLDDYYEEAMLEWGKE